MVTPTKFRRTASLTKQIPNKKKFRDTATVVKVHVPKHKTPITIITSPPLCGKADSDGSQMSRFRAVFARPLVLESPRVAPWRHCARWKIKSFKTTTKQRCDQTLGKLRERYATCVCRPLLSVEPIFTLSRLCGSRTPRTTQCFSKSVPRDWDLVSSEHNRGYMHAANGRVLASRGSLHYLLDGRRALLRILYTARMDVHAYTYNVFHFIIWDCAYSYKHTIFDRYKILNIPTRTREALRVWNYNMFVFL